MLVNPATGLNVKQEKFVQEYLVDLNAKQAAIRAGYSPHTAESQGSRLLGHAKVAELINAKLAASSKKAALTIERVDQEIARLAFSDMRKLYDADGNLKPQSEWDDDTAAAVASLEITSASSKDKSSAVVKKLKLWDKGSALLLASRRLGILKDGASTVTVNLTLEQLIMMSYKSPDDAEKPKVIEGKAEAAK